MLILCMLLTIVGILLCFQDLGLNKRNIDFYGIVSCIFGFVGLFFSPKVDKPKAETLPAQPRLLYEDTEQFRIVKVEPEHTQEPARTENHKRLKGHQAFIVSFVSSVIIGALLITGLFTLFSPNGLLTYLFFPQTYVPVEEKISPVEENMPNMPIEYTGSELRFGVLYNGIETNIPLYYYSHALEDNEAPENLTSTAVKNKARFKVSGKDANGAVLYAWDERKEVWVQCYITGIVVFDALNYHICSIRTGAGAKYYFQIANIDAR